MQNISISTLLLFVFFLIIISAFFSASETGLMSINRYRLRHLAKKKNKTAMRVQKLLERPDRLLSVILIGNNIANIVASAITTLIGMRLYGELGVLFETIALTICILIFAEIAPKTIAAIYPKEVAFGVSIPLTIVLKVLYPLVWFANLLVTGVLRLIGIKVKEQKIEHLSGEELRTVVREAGALLPLRHKEMLMGILDLEKIYVEDIMIPRNDIVGIDLNEDWNEIIKLLTTSEHTRLPLYRGNIDHVEGFVHLRTVVHLLAEGELNQEILAQIIQPLDFIPVGTSLNKQLSNFQKSKARLGLVVDEYGDIQGLTTLDDILEEIVGAYTTDFSDSVKEIHPQLDGSFLVDGSVVIRELNRTMDWKFPVKGPKTLSGLIIEYLETIPTPGTSLRLAGYPIEILQVKDNMIKTVRISPLLYQAAKKKKK